MEGIYCLGLTFRRYFGQTVNANRYFNGKVLCQSIALVIDESTAPCCMESTAWCFKGYADVSEYCYNGQKYE